MSPEEYAARTRGLGPLSDEDAARLRLLGTGGAGMAGQLKAGRQGYLDALEGEATGAPPPVPPAAPSPEVQRSLARRLRELFSK